ncbi:MAG TPA: cold shock domain-containing protein CspD [Spongiibacteraceae bacterium]|nr:cold shock domain-containing protein CspD [Spongiibacteraceae bacterium]
MQTGIVKWFNNTKGYGFILSESGGGDIFAHYSAIDMDGYKTLKAGQTVQFDTEQGPKGLHAKNIQAGLEPIKTESLQPEPLDLPQLSEA